MDIRIANRFRVAAAFILGLTALFWLISGIIGAVQGVPREIYNIVFALVIFFLMALCSRRPLMWGIITSSLGVVLAMYFLFALPDFYTALLPLFLMCAPLAIGGLLFIEADWAMKKKD
jgi:uncharacterized membrane protein YcfT